MKLYDLMTDNRRENILVGSKKPVFGWRVETEKKECAPGKLSGAGLG
ncbi:MAG: hypothetical protein ACLURP_08330 [Ruminococcus sp.]